MLPAALLFATVQMLLGGGATPTARADGGTLVAREAWGRLVVSLLVAPVPVRAGTVEASVWVQDRDTGAPVATPVSIHWWPAGRPERRARVAARAGHGANRLLAGARLAVPAPGRWILEVRAASGRLRTELEVGPEEPPLRSYWKALAIPPVGAALLVLHGFLRGRTGLRNAASDRDSSRPPRPPRWRVHPAAEREPKSPPDRNASSPRG